MGRTYITGHKNPDMDSVCAAWCFGRFKNLIDPQETYVPIRAGNLNKQTRAVFDALEAEPPRLMSDITPRVTDVAQRDILCLDENDPILTAVRELDERTISLIPVFREGRLFSGILTIHEITQFFLADNSAGRPMYNFRISNFERVLPGYFYRRGHEAEFTAPLMTGVMPLDISLDRIKDLGTEKPLLVMGLREDLLKYAVENQFPAIVITGMTRDMKIPVDLADYEGSVFISRTDTAETIRLLRLSAPLKNILNTRPPRLESHVSFDEARDALLESSLRGLPVFTGEDFEGVVTRRCFIERPEVRLILVDHNELAQSVNGAEQARITEIHDHHRLGTIKTREPIVCNFQPVGSTCTIIYGLYKSHGLEPDEQTAGLLLSGILSDTVILKSPTATERDRQAVEELSALAGKDYKEWGEFIFSAGLNLMGQDPKQLIFTDYKEYDEFGYAIGVGQLEVTNLSQVQEVKEEYLRVMKSEKAHRGRDWLMLLITNVTTSDSVLLSSGFPPGDDRLLYEKVEDNLFDLPGILSRKKQLLPEILRVLEEIGR